MTKPYSQACENNKHVILERLADIFREATKVLEIGSGTGQHAVHFARHMPFLDWYCADQKEYHEGIQMWMEEYRLANLFGPLEIKFPSNTLPISSCDAVFTANTAHIMYADAVESMLKAVSKSLPIGGVFCQYGPFTENKKFNSESNAQFHEKLLASGYGGYKDIEELKEWAPSLTLESLTNMPANNLLLVWRKHY